MGVSRILVRREPDPKIGVSRIIVEKAQALKLEALPFGVLPFSQINPLATLYWSKVLDQSLWGEELDLWLWALCIRHWLVLFAQDTYVILSQPKLWHHSAFGRSSLLRFNCTYESAKRQSCWSRPFFVKEKRVNWPCSTMFLDCTHFSFNWLQLRVERRWVQLILQKGP